MELKQENEISVQERLKNYIDLYLSDKRSNQDELEIRFGTKHYNPITKIDFENIIAKIKSLGFKASNIEGETYLNIQNDVYLGKKLFYKYLGIFYFKNFIRLYI